MQWETKAVRRTRTRARSKEPRKTKQRRRRNGTNRRKRDSRDARARAILRHVLSEGDPEQPIRAEFTTGELVDRALSRERFQSGLLVPFGLGAALLAAIGVFGIVGEAAHRRLPELTLRQALGATRRQVVAQLLRWTVACVLVGEAVGLVLAVVVGDRLNLILFEVDLSNPLIMVAACSMLLGVSLAACIRPTTRAVGQDLGMMLRQ
jgi:putative ABC transport system permease protein